MLLMFEEGKICQSWAVGLLWEDDNEHEYFAADATSFFFF